MFYSIDLLSPKGALGNVWVMLLLFRDAIFVRVGSLIARLSFLNHLRANEFFVFFFAYLKRHVVLRALTTTKLSLSLYRF